MKRKPASFLMAIRALKRAEEIGTTAAAEEFNVNVGTICRWRREVTEAYESIYNVVPAEVSEDADLDVGPQLPHTVVPSNAYQERVSNVLDRLQRCVEEAEHQAKEAQYLAHQIIDSQFGGEL